MSIRAEKDFTAAQLAGFNHVYDPGVIIITSDAPYVIKIGDGATPYNSLPAVNMANQNNGRVRAATTANITIATALNNGDTLDGVTLATGDYVLVKDQDDAELNGVYKVGASPARAPEYDTYNEHVGALIAVTEGTANADTLWLCISNAGGTLGSTDIDFSAFGVGGLAEWTPAGSGNAASLAFAEDTDNGAHKVTLKAPDSVTADVDVTLPDAAGTLATTTGVGANITSYLATTVTYNDTDTLADTALSVTVVASGIYDIQLYVETDSAVTGLKVDFGGTATITNVIGRWWNYAEDTLLKCIRVTSAGADVTAADGDNTVVLFQGSVEIANAGTFLLRGAQTVADASDTTILRGSTLTLTRMS